MYLMDLIKSYREKLIDNPNDYSCLLFALQIPSICSRIEIPNTKENLEDAAAGENFEWTDMYRKMAEDARAEGFDHIAFLFESVAEIEKEHDDRYRKLIENMEDGLVFSRDGEKIWKCRNCGHIVIGKEAPEVCPVCNHPKAYFEIKAENY